MADSMIDWMVLHESKVAIVMDGSFGASGAKGNGKYMNVVPNNLCSGLRVTPPLQHTTQPTCLIYDDDDDALCSNRSKSIYGS